MVINVIMEIIKNLSAPYKACNVQSFPDQVVKIKPLVHFQHISVTTSVVKISKEKHQIS